MREQVHIDSFLVANRNYKRTRSLEGGTSESLEYSFFAVLLGSEYP